MLRARTYKATEAAAETDAAEASDAGGGESASA
jgi:hypothetical protein